MSENMNEAVDIEDDADVQDSGVDSDPIEAENEAAERTARKRKVRVIMYYEDPPIPGVLGLPAHTTMLVDSIPTVMKAVVNFPTIKTRASMRAEGRSWEELMQYYIDTWGVEILMQLAEKALIVNAQDQMRSFIRRDSLPELQALGTNFIPLRKKTKLDANTAARVLRDNISNITDSMSSELLKTLLETRLNSGTISKDAYEQLIRSLNLQS